MKRKLRIRSVILGKLVSFWVDVYKNMIQDHKENKLNFIAGISEILKFSLYCQVLNTLPSRMSMLDSPLIVQQIVLDYPLFIAIIIKKKKRKPVQILWWPFLGKDTQTDTPLCIQTVNTVFEQQQKS